MFEDDIKSALHSARVGIPDGFGSRMDLKAAHLVTQKSAYPRAKHGFALAAAIALMLAMATAIATGIITWRHGLDGSMQISDGIKEKYGETGIFGTPDISHTHNGVTVMLDQAVVDGYAAYISFRVSGYEPQQGRQPGFESAVYTIDGSDDIIGSSWFFDGLHTDESGNTVYENGTPVDRDLPLQYANEDGDMIYIISMLAKDNALDGKTIHVSLENIGMFSHNGDIDIDVYGTWAFEWQLQDADISVEINDLNAAIGDSGCSLKYVRLSPIYIELTTDISYVDAAIPLFDGVRFKDGSAFRLLANGGSKGYLNDKMNEYRQLWTLDRIIDIDDVEYLIFVNGDDFSHPFEVNIR